MRVQSRPGNRSQPAVAIAAGLWLCACASAPPSPFFGDEKYLRIGVEPLAEADALVRAHEARGAKLVRRIEGHDFTALGFAGPANAPGSVRVVTRRGIALALGGLGEPSENDQAYALLASPIEHTQDADRDGFEEIFVLHERRTQRAQPGAACVEVFRARDVGFVDAVPVILPSFGASACPNDVVDVDADGSVELISEVTLAPGEGPPRVRVPLSAAGHEFRNDVHASATQRFVASERAQRIEDLARARQTLDTPTSLRLAVELAALAQAAGADVSARVSAFDDALAGLVLHEDEAARVLQARELVLQGFPAQPSPTRERAARNAPPQRDRSAR